MCSTRRSSERGFTLIELMVGVLIGLLSALAVTQVMVTFEAQKRSTTSGSDAQVNGALALDALQRALQPAGYGFGANPGALGCPLVARYEGSAPAGFPTTLAPVVITDGASGAPDTLSILASGKRSFSLPVRVATPGASANPASFPLASVMGIEGPTNDGSGNRIHAGDLLVAASDTATSCDLFQVTSIAGTSVARGASSEWNTSATGGPTGAGGAWPEGSYVMNLGTPSHQIYTVANGSLRLSALSLDPSSGEPAYSPATEVFPGIVNLQAQYGRDTNGDGSVDTWDNATPANNGQWRQVLAVRLAVVARSGQYEKTDNANPSDPRFATATCPTWSGGTLRIPGSASACAAYPNTADEEWKHYRYKVFETVVPLRNLLWNAT